MIHRQCDCWHDDKCHRRIAVVSISGKSDGVGELEQKTFSLSRRQCHGECRTFWHGQYCACGGALSARAIMLPTQASKERIPLHPLALAETADDFGCGPLVDSKR
jgi:hypothetical protein